MNVELYTTGCPRCNVLEKKLEQTSLPYDKKENFDVEELVKLGFDAAPVLKVDGEYMNFTDAIKWINEGGTNCR